MMYGGPYRRYRRQMRRAFRGRHGGYPVMFPIPYESLSLVTLAAFSRWAYRNRSAFGPFAITAALFVTAVNLYHHHPGATTVIATATGLVVMVMAFPRRLPDRWPGGRKLARLLAKVWDTCGIGRPVERAYATAVIATAGRMAGRSRRGRPNHEAAANGRDHRDICSRYSVVGTPATACPGPRVAHDPVLAEPGREYGTARLPHHVHRC